MLAFMNICLHICKVKICSSGNCICTQELLTRLCTTSRMKSLVFTSRHKSVILRCSWKPIRCLGNAKKHEGTNMKGICKLHRTIKIIGYQNPPFFTYPSSCELELGLSDNHSKLTGDKSNFTAEAPTGDKPLGFPSCDIQLNQKPMKNLTEQSSKQARTVQCPILTRKRVTWHRFENKNAIWRR